MLKIPVFAHTEETIGFIEMGVDYPMTDCDIKHRYFINIDSVGEYFDKMDRVTYGTVCSGGSEFITTLSLEDLLNKINPPEPLQAR